VVDIPTAAANSEDFGDAFQGTTNIETFQTVNVCQFGSDYFGLIIHHAGGKHSKEQSFDQKTENRKHLGRVIQAGNMVAIVTSARRIV
jgi:hypothetical protein